ncbi:TatD family hydrolase [Holophaga foetida]|uniref:TatD family hydrolase n=1 Tax=Holophaga foetida TaxID=35839 RepID=UPI001B7F8E87|nr:TatD family hydrolase [Holophaga foetida]
MEEGGNMLVDAHCHLRGGEEEIEATLARARKAGVGGFVAVAAELADAEPVLTVARRHADVVASLGVHPHEASTWNLEGEARLEGLLMAPEVRFVGETGLDWHYDLSPRDVQERVFRAQIGLARRLGKPLMIHTRAAGLETLRILREEGTPVVPGVIHCFSEDRTFAQAALDMGFYLSFSGIITFKKAADIAEIAAWAPLDRILVETDSPYLAPVPHRGRTNEPAYVVHVARHLASLRGLSFESLVEQTTQNLEALCGWAPSS